MLSPFSKFTLTSLLLVASSADASAAQQAHAGTTLNTTEARVLTRDGSVESLGSTRVGELTPLGSIWKLFAYAYQSERGASEADYTCRGQNPEELFCCKPGETIDRDQALARSCSPYFEPKRLGINQDEWRKFWDNKVDTNNAPTWLTDLKLLKPETRVSVAGLLQALQDVRLNFKTFDRIESATLGTVLNGTASNSLKTWGTTLRVKTFTWRDDKTAEDSSVDELGFTGGFAGWLPDGSSIWVSRAGHGRDAFQLELKDLVQKHMQTQDSGCVRVTYFDRYPIKSVTANGSASGHVLSGPVKVQFKNGNTVQFQGDGSLFVTRSASKIQITAEMPVNQYVARVLDREVSAQPVDAARSFAVAIRTYLYQNSKESGSCFEIADSSHLQRVNPEAASGQSLQIARWTDGLVLNRVEKIRYHSTTESSNRMSWVKAKSLALSGFSMPEILKSAYPSGLISYGAPKEILSCVPSLIGARWIAEQSKKWRMKLNDEPGFELPTALKVCQTNQKVFSDLLTQEIYVPKLRTHQDEISILHEYLHIGFRAHPKGRDEQFIEKQARALLEEQ